MKKENYIKAGLFFSSLIISLLVLEGVLRLMGSFVVEDQASTQNYNTDEFYEIYVPDKNISQPAKARIYCLGDSFTNGGNFQKKWEENYPHHLSNLLSSSGHPSQVLNMGLCEDTTLGVFERIERVVQNMRVPKGIKVFFVLLVGSADTFHTKARQEHTQTQWFTPNKKISERFRPWYFDLRVYKAFRHIEFSLKHIYLLWTTEQSKYAHLWNQSERYYKLVLAKKEKDAEKVLEESIKAIKKSDEYINSVNNPKEFYKDIINPMVNSLVNAHLEVGDYATALKKIIYLGNEFPMAWTVYAMRYLSFQMYLKQSEIGVGEILNSLKKNSAVFEHKDVNAYYKKLQKSENIEKLIDKKRLAIWENIVNLLYQKDIQLIIQNYPSEYKGVNGLLEQVAKKYNIPFVDNRSVFKALINKEGRSKYLKGDDHCTDLGYKVMAQNVQKKIEELL